MKNDDSLIESGESPVQVTYKDFISKIEIEQIHVKRMNMESIIPPDQLRDMLRGDRRIEIDVSHEFELEHEDGQAKHFLSLGQFQASARIQDNIIFNIEVDLTGLYDASQIEGEIPEKIYKKFVQENVPVNLWPYAREIIHNGTTRMGYPPLVLRPYRRV